jgi:hypothetical protein
MLSSSPSPSIQPVTSSTPSIQYRSPGNGPRSRSSTFQPSPRFSVASPRKPPALALTVSSPPTTGAVCASDAPPQSIVGDEVSGSSDLGKMTLVPPTAPSGPASSPKSEAIPKTESPEVPTKRRQQADALDATPATETVTTQAKRTKATLPTAKVLPARYELCPVEDIVILIANMIAELISTNDQLPLRDGGLTRFHSRYML